MIWNSTLHLPLEYSCTFYSHSGIQIGRGVVWQPTLSVTESTVFKVYCGPSAKGRHRTFQAAALALWTLLYHDTVSAAPALP